MASEEEEYVVDNPFSAEGRRKLREEISLQEIDIRLQELELVESIIEKLDKQIASVVARDEKAKSDGHTAWRCTVHGSFSFIGS